MPTVNEIREHFLSNAPWVDREKTVDTVKAGEPSKPVGTVAVGWMATVYDLRRAAELGCDLFVTHEPTFWEHGAPEERNRSARGGLEKTRLIEESGIAVLRCHDTWDLWPGIGIRDSWARGLGLGELVLESPDRWHAMYAIEETTLRAFAGRVLSKVQAIGADSVQVMGEASMKVSRPSVGVGCGGPGIDMIEAGSDCLICCFDGASYWSQRERFVECGAGVITVEHGTSEHWGLEALAGYVRQTWPELTVHYLDLYPRPWTVGCPDSSDSRRG